MYNAPSHYFHHSFSPLLTAEDRGEERPPHGVAAAAQLLADHGAIGAEGVDGAVLLPELEANGPPRREEHFAQPRAGELPPCSSCCPSCSCAQAQCVGGGGSPPGGRGRRRGRISGETILTASSRPLFARRTTSPGTGRSGRRRSLLRPALHCYYVRRPSPHERGGTRRGRQIAGGGRHCVRGS